MPRIRFICLKYGVAMSNQESKIAKNRARPESLGISPAEISSAVRRVVVSCINDISFCRTPQRHNVSQEYAVEIINHARRLIFPGYFSHAQLSPVDLHLALEREGVELFSKLSDTVVFCFKHKCLEDGRVCAQCLERARKTAIQFFDSFPELRATLLTDVRAALEGDPAAKSYDEVIMSYPGLQAITIYRMAHRLYEMNVPLLPRIMTEYAHSLTGIDIHPGATIGRSFFIDHGTGVVIGETTGIGNRVRVYQGVTLGALSLPRDKIDLFRDEKRHPTIEDDVVIYANATILGPEAVIGARSIIGGNVWITERVPPDTKVMLKRPELVYIGNHETPPAAKISVR